MAGATAQMHSGCHQHAPLAGNAIYSPDFGDLVGEGEVEG